MKKFTQLMALLICAIFSFPALADGNTQYCQKGVTSGSGSQTIQLTCQQISSGNYEMKIEASVPISGFGGSFFEINGVGGGDIRNFPITYTNEIGRAHV